MYSIHTDVVFCSSPHLNPCASAQVSPCLQGHPHPWCEAGSRAVVLRQLWIAGWLGNAWNFYEYLCNSWSLGKSQICGAAGDRCVRSTEQTGEMLWQGQTYTLLWGSKNSQKKMSELWWINNNQHENSQWMICLQLFQICGRRPPVVWSRGRKKRYRPLLPTVSSG